MTSVRDGWHGLGRPVDIALHDAAERAAEGADEGPAERSANRVPDGIPGSGGTGASGAAGSARMPPVPVPIAGTSSLGGTPRRQPVATRDRQVPGPSLPRRAGSLVRRWVTRVVSFLRRLPGRLGLTSGDADTS